MSKFIAPSEITPRNVVLFVYNNEPRLMGVDKVTSEFIQGKLLPHDGELPSRAFASFRFDKMQSPIERVGFVMSQSQENFCLSDCQ